MTTSYLHTMINGTTLGVSVMLLYFSIQIYLHWINW